MPAKVKPKPVPIPVPVAAPAPAPVHEVLTPSEAAAFLRVTVDQLVEEAKAGRVPARKIGAEWRFLKVALEEWMSSQPLLPDLNEVKGMISRLREELIEKIKPTPPPTPNWKDRILSVAGIWKDDDTIDEMLAEIYRQRGRPMVEEAR